MVSKVIFMLLLCNSIPHHSLRLYTIFDCLARIRTNYVNYWANSSLTVMRSSCGSTQYIFITLKRAKNVSCLVEATIEVKIKIQTVWCMVYHENKLLKCHSYMTHSNLHEPYPTINGLIIHELACDPCSLLTITRLNCESFLQAGFWKSLHTSAWTSPKLRWPLGRYTSSMGCMDERFIIFFS